MHVCCVYTVISFLESSLCGNRQRILYTDVGNFVCYGKFEQWVKYERVQFTFSCRSRREKHQRAFVAVSKWGAVSSDLREDKQDTASHSGVPSPLTFSYEHQESPIKHWPPLLAPASDILWLHGSPLHHSLPVYYICRADLCNHVCLHSSHDRTPSSPTTHTHTHTPQPHDMQTRTLLSLSRRSITCTMCTAWCMHTHTPGGKMLVRVT